jgi:CBS domain-containing protein
MEQIRTVAPAQESSFHPRPAATTITDLMQLPPTTVQQHDHAAAAANLMKHAGTTALMVVDARAGRPTGIITSADIAAPSRTGKTSTTSGSMP